MYEELYQENRGLLLHVARRYAAACQRDRAVSVEDLTQAGFFGLVKAQQTYDPARGSWAAWAAWAITKEIYKALGLYDGRPIKAHWAALSLDAPLNLDEPDAPTGVDVLEDTSLPATDEALNLDNMRQYVRRAIERIQSDRQRLVMQLCGLEGKPYEAAAAILGVSVSRVQQIREKALEALRNDKALREDARADIADIELRTPYYCHVGVNTFRSTHTSATEKAVLWRMDREQRRAASMERLKRIEQELNEREAQYEALRAEMAGQTIEQAATAAERV